MGICCDRVRDLDGGIAQAIRSRFRYLLATLAARLLASLAPSIQAPHIPWQLQTASIHSPSNSACTSTTTILKLLRISPYLSTPYTSSWSASDLRSARLGLCKATGRPPSTWNANLALCPSARLSPSTSNHVSISTTMKSTTGTHTAGIEAATRTGEGFPPGRRL